MYQIFQYLKFLFSSSNQHGVHSPFVFDMVVKCFYDKTPYPDYAALKAYRSELTESKKEISVEDFGSGSRVFKSRLRSVSKMAKTSGTPLKRMKLLFQLVNYFKPTKILELGTSLGLSTSAMALGNPASEILTVEGCHESFKIAQNQFEKFGLNNISARNERFETTIPELRQNRYDLIFFDGNHNKKATLDYFEKLLATSHNESIFIFDDIYWSKDMTEAWEIIKNHPKVTVTIDTFHWGFVFFRTEQAKEHFKIRV
ncbi:MAG: class I SAM-dependent methyltransferase [Bacteroidota bacterium]